jgi:hypothetical protein
VTLLDAGCDGATPQSTRYHLDCFCLHFAGLKLRFVTNRRSSTMTPNTIPATDPVPPALIAATLDTLAMLPNGHRLEPELLITISRRIGGSEAQSVALLVRIRAAAIVFRDPRWLHWSAYFRACSADAHCVFDAAILHIIAALPLTPALRFSADDFFTAVLDRTQAAGHS